MQDGAAEVYELGVWQGVSMLQGRLANEDVAGVQVAVCDAGLTCVVQPVQRGGCSAAVSLAKVSHLKTSGSLEKWLFRESRVHTMGSVEVVM